MDHLVYLAQERLQSAQINLHSAAGQVGAGVRAWGEEASSSAFSAWDRLSSSGMPAELGRNISARLKEIIQFIRHVVHELNPRDVYNRCVFFFVKELTRAHVCFGVTCFLIGGVGGIFLGVRLRASLVAPQRMRAVVANSYRGLESIAVVEDELAPRLSASNQVLVHVKAAGVDYLDVRIAQGYAKVLRQQLNKYNPNVTGELPVVLGRECSGVVVAVGRDVTKLTVGDEVWAAVPVYHVGTMSEYAVLAEDLVAVKPQQLTFEGAAALPFALMTAWDALVTQAGLGEHTTKGKRVLVHAGASSVGLVAVQLVLAWGGNVTTTVNSHAASLLQMLGAQDIITYDNSNFDKELMLREKFDVILNTVGPVLHESCSKHCAPGGVVVTSVIPRLPSDAFGLFWGSLYAMYLRIRYCFSQSPWVTGDGFGSVRVSGQVLDAVDDLVTAGRLQPVVDKTYSAQDAEVAFAHVAKEEQIGRTVIRFRARPIARTEGAFSAE